MQQDTGGWVIRVAKTNSLLFSRLAEPDFYDAASPAFRVIIHVTEKDMRVTTHLVRDNDFWLEDDKDVPKDPHRVVDDE